MDGDDLREQRIELGLSPEELADELGVLLTTYTRWEQMGAAELPNAKMLQLALEALRARHYLRNKKKR